MFLVRYFYAMLFSAISLPAGAGESMLLPSDPASWNGDFLQLVQPTEKCPGGTVEQLGRRMSVSEPYTMSQYETLHRDSLPSMSGIADSDHVHSFYFRSELPGGTFWGFGGYLVARGDCVIHAKVTTHDN